MRFAGVMRARRIVGALALGAWQFLTVKYTALWVPALHVARDDALVVEGA